MSSNIEDIEKKLSEQVDALTLSNKNLSENLVTITQAQSVCVDAKDSSASSASEAKGYRDQASEIAGLNDVAGAMGLLSKVYGVHDLDIPFNDGINVTHGFGPLTFSRLSEATDINKSGIQTTYAVDEPVITQDGIACFGKLTNLILYSEDFSQWSLNGAPTVTGGIADPNGGSGAFEISISSATQGIYQSGIPSGNTYTYSVWLRGLGAKVRMGSNTSEEITLTDEWVRYVRKQDNAGSMTIYAAEANTTFEVYGAQTVAGNIPNAPYIPTSGTATSREADTPKVQAENNLPANGKPFYIVVDVKETEVNETYARIVRVSDGSLSCYYANGQLAIAVKLSEGGLKTVATSDPQAFTGDKRFIFAYTGNSLVIYADGVKHTEQDCGNLAVNFTSNIFFGSTNGTQYFLNSYIKNFKIKHGVITDDLAKAYGKWGE